MRTREIRRGDFEAVTELGLSGNSLAARDPKVFSSYIELLRRIGGEAIVLEEEGEILGEAEIVPQAQLSVAGPHAFLVNLLAIKEDRALLSELIGSCRERAKSWGFDFMDYIPKSGESSLYGSLGFTKTMTKQVQLAAQPRRMAVLARASVLIEAGYPSDLALLAGEMRPGRLAWEILTAGLLGPIHAYRVGMGRLQFVAFIGPEANGAPFSLYGTLASGPGEIFGALGAILSSSEEIGLARVRTLIWGRYLTAFESADFEVLEEVILMRMRVG